MRIIHEKFQYLKFYNYIYLPDDQLTEKKPYHYKTRIKHPHIKKCQVISS